MKKFISILLVVTIVSPLWLFYSILQYEKYITKKEIKNFLVSGIDKNELVFFIFSKEETETKLVWEHSKEFEFMNEMYDVVDTEIKGDSIYYWCWWDYDETELNKQLNLLVKQATNSNQQNRERTEKLQNLLSSLYFTNVFSLNDFFNNEGKNIYSRYQFNYSTRDISPDTPPPRI